MGKKKQEYEENDSISPSSYEFWEEFYENGEGSGEVYEWYVEFKHIREPLLSLVKDNDNLLHIGCGNSLLAEELVEELDKFSLSIKNIDVCQNAIDRMNERKESQNSSKLKSSLLYEVLDATNTGINSSSVNGVIDKGTCDALLSTLEIEIGDNEMVKKLLEEMYRILTPGGFLLVVSRNTCLEPYFYNSSDENIEWKLTRSDLVTPSKKGKNITQVNYIYLAFKSTPVDDNNNHQQR